MIDTFNTFFIYIEWFSYILFIWIITAVIQIIIEYALCWSGLKQ